MRKIVPVHRKKKSFQKIFWKERMLCGKKEKHFQKEEMEVSQKEAI